MNESFLPFVVCVAEKLSETRVRTMVRFIGEKVIEWNTVSCSQWGEDLCTHSRIKSRYERKAKLQGSFFLK
jgi:electron transfer flavoprotein alpha/beta subunit